ncbi:hypothetical protein ACFPRL_21610 [Pseudoclavibacter helvolus]
MAGAPSSLEGTVSSRVMLFSSSVADGRVRRFRGSQAPRGSRRQTSRAITDSEALPRARADRCPPAAYVLTLSQQVLVSLVGKGKPRSLVGLDAHLAPGPTSTCCA